MQLIRKEILLVLLLTVFGGKKFGGADALGSSESSFASKQRLGYQGPYGLLKKHYEISGGMQTIPANGNESSSVDDCGDLQQKLLLEKLLKSEGRNPSPESNQGSDHSDESDQESDQESKKSSAHGSGAESEVGQSSPPRLFQLPPGLQQTLEQHLSDGDLYKHIHENPDLLRYIMEMQRADEADGGREEGEAATSAASDSDAKSDSSENAIKVLRQNLFDDDKSDATKYPPSGRRPRGDERSKAFAAEDTEQQDSMYQKIKRQAQEKAAGNLRSLRSQMANHCNASITSDEGEDTLLNDDAKNHFPKKLAWMVTERSYDSFRVEDNTFSERIGSIVFDMTAKKRNLKRKEISQLSKKVFFNLYEEQGDRIPLVTHRIWITNGDNPFEAPQEDLTVYLQSLTKLKGDWKHFFWCIDPEKIPETIRALKDSPCKISIKKLDNIWGKIKGRNIISTYLINNMFGFANDIIRANIVYLYGGGYFDFGSNIDSDLSILFRAYDVIISARNGFIDWSFFAFKKGDNILLQYLNYVERAFTLPAEIKALVKFPPQSHEIIFKPALSAILDKFITLEGRLLVVPDHPSSPLQVKHRSSWLRDKGLFGNRSIWQSNLNVLEITNENHTQIAKEHADQDMTEWFNYLSFTQMMTHFWQNYGSLQGNLGDDPLVFKMFDKSFG